MTSGVPAGAVVTRREFVAAVRLAFESGPASRAALIAHAESVGARPEVLGVLGDLPDARLVDLRALSTSLRELPRG